MTADKMSEGGFEKELQFCQKQHWGETFLPVKCFSTQRPKQRLQPTPKVLQALLFLTVFSCLSLPFPALCEYWLGRQEVKRGRGEKLFLAFSILWHACPIKLFGTVRLTPGQNKTRSEMAEKFLRETQVVQLPAGSKNVPKH